MLTVIIGLLSDSHGCYERTVRAVELLDRLGAEALVHCGDVGGEQVIEALAGKRAWFVWGNTDYHDPALERFAESVGVQPPARIPLILEFDGFVTHVYHGHEPEFTNLARSLERDASAAESLLSGVDLVAYGHTHEAAHFTAGSVEFVNPGALHRARPHSVATVDTESREIEHWIVSDDAAPLDAPVRMRLETR
ncbi:MAG: YfcE family phosphodiesterase [Planctomycetota bacterium]|nr:MAG: YfcE family phosphodiesterase [Planctomycetota bacterium]